MNNEANLYHHLLIQVNMVRTLNVTESHTESLKWKGRQRLTTPRECKVQWKEQNNYCQNNA